MQLYLMRHGEAVSSHDWPSSDSARPLTPIGMARLDASARDMSRCGLGLQSIITSPLERACQTSDIIATHFKGIAPLIRSELKTGATPDAIRTAIFKTELPAPMLVVGHMPDIAVFAARATGDANILDHGFRTGEMVALDASKLAEKWGAASVIWWRTLDDWENL